jgi:hypothetical protein
VETLSLTPEMLRTTMLRLQQRVERANAGFVQRYGFLDRADFFQHYLRLSELLVRGSTLQAAGAGLLSWINPQAKYPLPGKMRTTLYRSHNS